MSGLRRESAIRRERPVACHIPYKAQVAANLVRTAEGDYVQVFRLNGASFESADDADLNNWHERLNVTWRNMASPNVAIWTHIVRRRERAAVQSPFRSVTSPRTTGVEISAATRRQRRSWSTRSTCRSCIDRLPARRPGLLAKALSRGSNASESGTLSDALEACEKLRATLLASFARYEPEPLSVYSRGDRQYSRPLEFFALMVNGEYKPVPLPARASIDEVLATDPPPFSAPR